MDAVSNLPDIFKSLAVVEMSGHEQDQTKIAVFRLLDLPAELRDLVYWHAVTIDTFTVQGEQLFDMMGFTEEQSNQMVSDRRQCLDSYRALARVNRQLHGEVDGVFFEQNRFEFWIIGDHVAAQLGEWVHRVHESFVARMRNVRIVQAKRAADGSVDITIPRNGNMYDLAWHGDPWGEQPNECIKQTDAYQGRKASLGNAMTAAKRHMRRLAKEHNREVKLQDPKVPRPYMNHAVEQPRGRTQERPPPVEFCFTPVLLRRILCDILPKGALEVPIGRQRFSCEPGRGCVSPEYCFCNDCISYRRGETESYDVDEEERMEGADGKGRPFTADYSWPWAYFGGRHHYSRYRFG